MTVSYVLRNVLDRILRLLHPYMPFVTEEIWQHLPYTTGYLIIAPWPEGGDVNAAERAMATVTEVVRAIRNARAEFGVEPGRWVEARLVAGPNADLLREQEAIIASLAKTRPLMIHSELENRPDRALHAVAGSVEVYLPLSGLIDLEEERARLQKDIDNLNAQISKLNRPLGKP